MLTIPAAKKLAMLELAMWPHGAHLEHNQLLSDGEHCVFLVLSYSGETLGSVSVGKNATVTTRKVLRSLATVR